MLASNSKPLVNGRNDEEGIGESLVGNSGFAVRAVEEEENLDDSFDAMRSMVGGNNVRGFRMGLE